MRQPSTSRSDGASASRQARESAQAGEPQPLPWRTTWVVLWGIAIWAVALVVTLVVPALRTGARSWWPWACVAGILLGLVGYTYVRRGRGNASDAH